MPFSAPEAELLCQPPPAARQPPVSHSQPSFPYTANLDREKTLQTHSRPRLGPAVDLVSCTEAGNEDDAEREKESFIAI